ncbi:NAD(P)H-dependent oxidoreductase [Lentzea sp. PSKA42]|uniref:NAD(P)H-dependent oxidoreductase n=1 Tax=Lentzea indica TaxID=2604800 RepID=A0ABX1FU68_9PSEU|nr:NAD(P)H-dependent oxidoreductase [Lentzea indica]NKE62374.1 NAD(P)H-dependent oxidoreductase [Lentzea indica]
MRAVVLNCTLKKSPDRSNTDLLAQVVVDELAKKHVEVTTFRLADHTIPPGITTDLGDGDEWPRIHEQLVNYSALKTELDYSRPSGALFAFLVRHWLWRAGRIYRQLLMQPLVRAR